MKTYAVHSKNIETPDCLHMLEVYPDRAEYGDFYLFAEPHKNPTQDIIDMRSITDMAEFDAAYRSLIEEVHTGRWVYLTQAQGKYLKKNYYPPETEEV